MSSRKLMIFDTLFSLSVYIYNCNNWSSSIICCRFSGDMYLFLGLPTRWIDVYLLKRLSVFWILTSTLWSGIYDFSCNLISSQISCCFSCFLDCLFPSSLKCMSFQLLLRGEEAFSHTYCSAFCPYFFQRIRIQRLWDRFRLLV